MKSGRPRSLQLRLAIRLTILYAIAAAVTIGILVFRAYGTAESLNDRELSRRAIDLARAVSADAHGSLHLALPPKLAAAYAAGSETDIFAIRTPESRIVAASPRAFGERVTGWSAPSDDPSYFHLTDLDHGARDYYGLSLAVSGASGPVVASDGRMSVADHGRGVPPEDREHIFKRFWRGRGARSGGAGLGLAIVSEIVKIHRGTVSVTDNIGGGAIFTISFPLESAARLA
jgi:hypothetical protein